MGLNVCVSKQMNLGILFKSNFIDHIKAVSIGCFFYYKFRSSNSFFQIAFLLLFTHDSKFNLENESFYYFTLNKNV